MERTFGFYPNNRGSSPLSRAKEKIKDKGYWEEYLEEGEGELEGVYSWLEPFTPPDTQPVSNVYQEHEKYHSHNATDNTQPVSVSEEEITSWVCKEFNITGLDFDEDVKTQYGYLPEYFNSFYKWLLSKLSTTQPTKVDEEWISVKDAMPPENTSVLCYNGHMMMQNSWMQYTNMNMEKFKEKFTHWQPLPGKPSPN